VVIKLREVVMILDPHRQGLTVSAIARDSASTARPFANASRVGWSRRSMGRVSRASDRPFRPIFAGARDRLSEPDRLPAQVDFA
jgi:hypothetical protein